jgi:hypothetical protein
LDHSAQPKIQSTARQIQIPQSSRGPATA